MHPTININLKPCECANHKSFGLRHWEHCPGTPIHVPCPIPRSVTFAVRLGECECGAARLRTHSKGSVLGPLLPCSAACPARPIRVYCGISGKTWEESEVKDVEVRPRETLVMVSTYDMPLILAACRDRWALVKALVTGQWPTVSAIGTLSAAIPALQAQRDAVFAAICEMARAEETAWKAQLVIVGAVPTLRPAPGMHHPTGDENRPSASWLAAYVGRLIEQVGVLGVES